MNLSKLRISLTSTDEAGEQAKCIGETVLIQLVTSPDFTGDFVVAAYASANGADTDQRLWTFNAAGQTDVPIHVQLNSTIRFKVLDAATAGHAEIFLRWGAVEKATTPVVRSQTLDGNTASAVVWWPTNGVKSGRFEAESSGWSTAVAEVVYRANESMDWQSFMPREFISPGRTATETLDLSLCAQVGVTTTTVEGGAQNITIAFSGTYD